MYHTVLFVNLYLCSWINWTKLKETMVAYLCPLHASYFSTDYVNMQDTYVNMQDKRVNMQIIMSTCKITKMQLI